jgi:hypothetical protein
MKLTFELDSEEDAHLIAIMMNAEKVHEVMFISQLDLETIIKSKCCSRQDLNRECLEEIYERIRIPEIDWDAGLERSKEV